MVQDTYRESLFKTLKSQKESAYRQAIIKLAAFDDEEVIACLVDMARNNPNQEKRDAALHGLDTIAHRMHLPGGMYFLEDRRFGSLGTYESETETENLTSGAATVTLIKAIESAVSTADRVRIIKDIGQNQPPEVIEALIPVLDAYLQSPHKTVQLITIHTLGRCRSVKVIDLLFPLLDSTGPQVKEAALTALGHTKIEYLVVRISEAVRSTDTSEHRRALIALELVGPADAHSLIKPLLSDPDPAVSARAGKFDRLLQRRLKTAVVKKRWSQIGTLGKIGLSLIAVIILVNLALSLFSRSKTSPGPPGADKHGTGKIDTKPPGIVLKARYSSRRQFLGSGYDLAMEMIKDPKAQCTRRDKKKLHALLDPLIVDGYMAFHNKEYKKAMGYFKQALTVHRDNLMITLYASAAMRDIYEVLGDKSNFEKYRAMYREARGKAIEKGLL